MSDPTDDVRSGLPDYTPAVRSGDRIVIVGGPKAGKSTLARQLRAAGYPTFCSDPRSTARMAEPDVTYMPETATWSSASDHVVTHWFPQPGPWVIEGHATARALRKQLQLGLLPVDQVLLLPEPYPTVSLTDRQVTLASSVMRVWEEIAPRLGDITQELLIDEPAADLADWSPLRDIRDLARRIGEAFHRE